MFPIAPLATAPVLALAPPDMDPLLHDRRAYHASYRPRFQRREPREGSAKYRHGLWLALPRQSIEPMVLALAGADRHTVRAMPPCLREGAWDAAAILRRHWPAVDHALGDDNAVLTRDGRDVPKPGTESVGVKRQYGGELGTRAHGPAGVCLG